MGKDKKPGSSKHDSKHRPTKYAASKRIRVRGLDWTWDEEYQQWFCYRENEQGIMYYDWHPAPWEDEAAPSPTEGGSASNIPRNSGRGTMGNLTQAVNQIDLSGSLVDTQHGSNYTLAAEPNTSSDSKGKGKDVRIYNIHQSAGERSSNVEVNLNEPGYRDYGGNTHSQGAYGPDAYGPHAAGQSAHGQGAYGPDAYGPGAYSQNAFTSDDEGIATEQGSHYPTSSLPTTAGPSTYSAYGPSEAGFSYPTGEPPPYEIGPQNPEIMTAAHNMMPGEEPPEDEIRSSNYTYGVPGEENATMAEYITNNQGYADTELLGDYDVRPSIDFQPGMMLRMPWCEPMGSKKADLVSDAHETVKFGNLVYQGIRRFLIIATAQGHSTCIAISTYEGKGCAKRGIKPYNHGIIHDDRRRPSSLEKEPKLGFDPVRVAMFEGETLDKRSRVNYAKSYNIEHNTRVQFVGQVPPKDFKMVQKAHNQCWANMQHEPKESKAGSSSKGRSSRRHHK